MRKAFNPRLFSLSSGYFSVPSGIAVIKSRFYKLTRGRQGDRIDPARIKSELIRRHEFAHYRQLMTTPFGLLVWRAYKTLLSNVNFIATAIADVHPALRNLEFPVQDWIRDGNLKKAYERGAQFSAQRISAWRELGETLPYIDTLVDEIDAINTFLYDLLDNTDATVGEFIENANLAYRALSKRSDLNIKTEWETDLPLDTPLNQGRFSGAELIEAAARLEERLFLEHLHKANEPIKMWEQEAIRGIYAPAYTWLMDELGESLAALGVLDASFMAPIDLAYSCIEGTKLKVEHVLPSFRIQKLALIATAEFWPTTSDGLDLFFGRTLCEKAGLAPPIEVAEVGISAALTGPESWGYDYKAADLPEVADISSLVDYSLAQFVRAMELRAKNPACLVQENRDDKSLVFRPLITFYDDVVVFGFDENLSRSDPRLYFLSFRQFSAEIVLTFLLGTDNSAELKRLKDLMVDRALNGHQPDDWFCKIFSTLRNDHNISTENVQNLFDISYLAKRLTAGHFPF